MERKRSRRGYPPRRRKTLGEKIKDFLRNFVAFMFSNVGIIGLVVGYTIVGALIFQKIEGSNTDKREEDANRERNHTANLLWNITCCGINPLEELVWRNEVTKLVLQYQEKLVSSLKKSGFDGAKSTDNWSFSGAFLYSLTVITTIGYGNVTPRTETGKVGTVVYAIIGMPLFLLYLSNIGDILAKSFKWTYAKLWLCRGCPGARRRRAQRAQAAARIPSRPPPKPPTRIPTRPPAWTPSRPQPGLPHRSMGHGDNHSWTPGAHPAASRLMAAPDYEEEWYPASTTRSVSRSGSRRETRSSTGRAQQSDRPGATDSAEEWADAAWAAETPRDTWDEDEDDEELELEYRRGGRRRGRSASRPRFGEDRLSLSSGEDSDDDISSVPTSGEGFPAPVDLDLELGRLPGGSSLEEGELDAGEVADAETDGSSDSSESYDPQTVTVPLTLCLAIMVGYVCGGAVLFSRWEKWDMLDGSYFCFISLSTIGFGDIVPGGSVYSDKVEVSFIFCSMYLMLGMALIAMCFNLMQEEVIHKIRSCIRTVRYMARCNRRAAAAGLAGAAGAAGVT